MEMQKKKNELPKLLACPSTPWLELYDGQTNRPCRNRNFFLAHLSICLKVSYCDHPLCVVHHQQLLQRTSKLLGGFGQNLAGMILI